MTDVEFAELVDKFKDELRESMRCRLAEVYYRKNDLVEAKDGVLDAFDNEQQDLGERIDSYAHDLLHANDHIAKLEAQLQSFRDFNAPLLRVAAEEEPGVWDYLQEEAHDDR